MTNDEELISNISYTNSDFRSIFPQLLDTAKKLTNKWDPSLSNESDPGNILIKEQAIVADKNNYHVDKNVLECFPLSATQQSSARQIYDLVGYNMHWYISALCNTKFTLLKSIDSVNNIPLKAGLKVSDASGEYTYTLLDQCILTTPREQKSVRAIQGVINKYEINGEYTITLENLDENRRIYFPHNVIAENGIYVYDSSTGDDVEQIGYHNNLPTDDIKVSYWSLVDNLSKYSSNSRIFKFGLDLDSDSCYIQFPEDIATTIGAGLNIYYVTTNGYSGNIKASILNKFTTDVPLQTANNETVVVNDYINISNDASAGGSDPETLTQAYNNYKKLIGTYDTLVSRRDYENAIYNLDQSNTNSLPVVYNSVVTDRTSDPNFSQKVMVSNGYTDYTKNFVVDISTNTPILKPYDIILYLLKSPSSLLTTKDYDESFLPDLSQSTKLMIEQDLDSVKSVQHNLNYVTDISSSPSLLDITNMVKLNGTLTTYYKVDKNSAKEIESNATRAIINAYNSRQLAFGDDINYDELIEVIKNSDARIKTVSLDTLSYEPHLLSSESQNSYKSLYNGSDDAASNFNNKTIAKMILSGNVQLFKFNDDFELDFGQVGGDISPVVSSISALNNIDINVFDTNDTSISPTVLDKNDIIQIVIPNLNVKEEYTATVKYTVQGLSRTIKAEEVYVLQQNETITCQVLVNNVPITKTLGNGTIIKPINIDLSNTSTTQILRANQSIQVLDFAQISIPTATYYYIVSNKIERINNENYYQITLTQNQPYVLQDNEYFVYTNQNSEGIIILGSGTTLLNTGSTFTLQSKVVSSLESIYSSNYDDISYESNPETVWTQLSDTQNITAQENQILTLTENDKIYITADSGSDSVELEYDLQALNSFGLSNPSIKYQISGEDQKSIDIIENLNNYSILLRSTMILACGPVTEQTLVGNQKIYLDGSNEQFIPTGSGSTADDPILNTFLFNYPLNMLGGKDINVQVLNEDTGEYENLIKVYKYSKQNAVNGNNTLTRKDGYINLEQGSADPTTYELNYTFNNSSVESDKKYYLLPIEYAIPVNSSIQFSLDNGKIAPVDIYLNQESNPTNIYSVPVDTTTSTITGSTVLLIVTNESKLTITMAGSSTGNKVSIGKIYLTDGLNTTEIDTKNIGSVTSNIFDYSISTSYPNVISQLLTLPGISEFDWSYRVPDSNKVLRPLSGDSYFNKNHVYNDFTISKINFEKSSLKVSSSSINNN